MVIDSPTNEPHGAQDKGNDNSNGSPRTTHYKSHNKNIRISAGSLSSRSSRFYYRKLLKISNVELFNKVLDLEYKIKNIKKSF